MHNAVTRRLGNADGFAPIVRSFSRNEDGTIAIIFALCCFVMFGILGLAIDGSRAYNTKSRVAYALDAAALEVAKLATEDGLRGLALEQQAYRVFLANLEATEGQRLIDFKDFDADYDPGTGRASVTVTTTVGTTFSGVKSLKELEFTNAAAAVYEIRDIEGALALDVTGSMSGQKLEDMKDAAQELVTTMIDNASPAQTTRMALAPYASTVRLGPYATRVTDPDVPSLDTCVVDRDGLDAYNDGRPGPGNYFNVQNPDAGSILSDVDSSEGTSNYACVSAPIVPLTDNKTDLTDAIEDFSANGYTAGHIGFTWAWNLISPNYDLVWPTTSEPADYDTTKTLKFIVLMTDGVFNTAWSNGRSSNDQASDLCTNAKSEGVVVFTVGFGSALTGTGPNETRDLLANCASPRGGDFTQTFFLADNGDDLKAAFQSIAAQINRVRVTG